MLFFCLTCVVKDKLYNVLNLLTTYMKVMLQLPSLVLMHSHSWSILQQACLDVLEPLDKCCGGTRRLFVYHGGKISHTFLSSVQDWCCGVTL